MQDVYNSNRVRRLHNFGSQHGHLANSRSRALVSLLLDTAQHEYIKGAATLAKSAMLYAPDYFNARVLLVVNGRNYSDQVLRQAQVVGWTLKWVDPIKPPHLASTSESKDMFARLHLWNMVEYSQVYLMHYRVATCLNTDMRRPCVQHKENPFAHGHLLNRAKHLVWFASSCKARLHNCILCVALQACDYF